MSVILVFFMAMFVLVFMAMLIWVWASVGGVVDVVAGHGYDLFLGLKALDYFVFLFW